MLRLSSVPVSAREGPAYEGLRRCQHPQCGCSRSRRIWQDTTGVGLACSMPAWSTGSARSTKAPPSPTTTKKKSPASTRSSASLAYAEWNKTKINLIDTPGFGNFFADARAALQVADGALVVVDAVAGVEVQTEKAWAACEELQLPRLIVVNRLDRERAVARADARLAARRRCGRTIMPIQLPIGEERAFTGVVDLVAMKAFTFGDRRLRQDHRGRGARRHDGRRQGRARSADRDGRGSRRSA